MTLLLNGPELDRIFPAHAVLDAIGRIRRVGPALRRRLDIDIVGSEFLKVVKVERPKSVLSFEALRATQGRLIMAMPAAGNLRLKGIVVNSGDQTFLLLSPAIDHHRVGDPQVFALTTSRSWTARSTPFSLPSCSATAWSKRRR